MATVAEYFLDKLGTELYNKFPSISIEIEEGTNNLWICDCGVRKIRFNGKINSQRISQGSYATDPYSNIVDPPTGYTP